MNPVGAGAMEEGPSSRINTAPGRTAGRKGRNVEEMSHLSFFPPPGFCQDLLLVKPIWKPDAKGAQMRQPTGDVLPGGEAENGGKAVQGTENASMWLITFSRLSTLLAKCHIHHFFMVLECRSQSSNWLDISCGLIRPSISQKWPIAGEHIAENTVAMKACSVSFIFHGSTNCAHLIAPNAMSSPLKMPKNRYFFLLHEQ